LDAEDPKQAGDFRLRARLGAGGMGRVYLGYSPGGRPVAVKVVHPELARDPEFMRRFRREVSAAQAVSDAYTAAVVGAGPDDSPPWLATTYVPGPPLSDLVTRLGPLPEDAVWRLAGGLAEALQAIHAEGLIHRDLKPGNILVAADGPRVIDFGISRSTSGTVVTATQMTIGTPAYMSPEQAQGLPVNPASDIFALGSVLAFASSGVSPFGGGEMFAIGYRVVNGEPDLTGVPASVRPLIDACLVKDPAGRPDLATLVRTVGERAADLPSVRPGKFWPDEVSVVLESGEFAPAPLPTPGATGVPSQDGPLTQDVLAVSSVLTPPGRPVAPAPAQSVAARQDLASPQSPAAVRWARRPRWLVPAALAVAVVIAAGIALALALSPAPAPKNFEPGVSSTTATAPGP
jgi:serine/threonine protein kinase